MPCLPSGLPLGLFAPPIPIVPCDPTGVSLPPPPPPIPGLPFALPLPVISPFPSGFPEDLLALFCNLQLLLPSFAFKAQLSLNFTGADIFDAILKLLDQFMPFLMLYNFFLPVLNLIVCIIEVICALLNPFALIGAVNNLFSVCIPAFLDLFPIFALIIIIISILLLIILLIEYLLSFVLKLSASISGNIVSLILAFQASDATGIIAIANKLGSLLCLFQNLFVLLEVFALILGVIEAILAEAFAIPPCSDSNPTGCCTPNVCPTIVTNTYTRNTGTFRYYPQVGIQTTVVLPPPQNNLTVDIRSEAWQFFDNGQNIAEALTNVYDGYDVTISPKPIFFPTANVYTASTAPSQAPYQVDLRLFYNPANWGRTGKARFVKFLNCIVSQVPSPDLIEGDNSLVPVPNSVATLLGGLGYEDDGKTVLTGFAANGVTPISAQATLANFIHMPAVVSASPTLGVNDGYTFTDVQYTFRPNIAPLLQANIVTLGCVPSIALNREFVNNVFAGNAGLQAAQLKAVKFPDPAAAQQCLSTALSGLRANLTQTGLAEFQSMTTVCLQQLQNDTQNALGSVINIGFDPCNSSFSLSPPIQFTTSPILVSVNLNERNGVPLTNSLPPSIADSIAVNIQGHPTFGKIGHFTYDGYQLFNALLTSDVTGSGELMISYNNQILCTNTIGAGESPTHTLQAKSYQFIYAPGGTTSTTGDGTPRRDLGDVARDGVTKAGE